MSPWERRYVGELIDALERHDRIPPAVATEARLAVDEDRYRDALDTVLAVAFEDTPPTGIDLDGDTYGYTDGTCRPVAGEE
ncbi:hypothetical protein [Halorubrum vacuolatum]|uniref:Uncharacterized protein n=1 Tax=Halorubrum vacuolatum TaxID=63740 RepID=A0A238VV06_HALVU|nr:hypothetical protein [Halorubrum vacuolatum]SNR37653.1 hypothetical protein SAMN06264855_10464 [Halorubrum vacuolatum]